jgi:hypothetical protein
MVDGVGNAGIGGSFVSHKSELAWPKQSMIPG